ncbi:HAD-like domain-containing protein [Aspergillus floccosus]
METVASQANPTDPAKPVLFFDIDNCLYSRQIKFQDVLSNLIDNYFEKHLGLSREEAIYLHQEYYKHYVDDALPLENTIKPDPELRTLLEDIDRAKVRLWLLTNAYKAHDERVVKLLGVDDLFEGLTYCNYAEIPLICKPHIDMFRKAMTKAGVQENGNCYFVDDSYSNCAGARQAGWIAAHLIEEGLPTPATPACQYQIRNLEELRTVYPQFFKPRE